jgi:hypothetical protein
VPANAAKQILNAPKNLLQDLVIGANPRARLRRW